MKYGVSEHDLALISGEIQKNLGTTKNPEIFLFGSRVKGNFRKYSDLDILLRAENYDQKSLAKIDFSGLDTVYKVDFILEPDLYEEYKEEILSHMVKLA